MKTEVQIEVQDLDHLGIIAGIVDEIGIVEVIDKEIGTDVREKVSAGQVVKAMIINCMGFLTAPLYLFSEFFEGKATEHLIGTGIKAEYLNDSRIGRVLDQIYEYGITILFIKIASLMAERFKIDPKIAHIDGTSMAVHGKYLQLEEAEIEQNLSVDLPLEQDSAPADRNQKDEEDLEPVSINITHGYSRDRRPDLKSLSKRIFKSLTAKLLSLKRLSNHEFACEADALTAATDFEKTLPYHLLNDLNIIANPHYQGQGRPRSGAEISHYTYQIQSNLIENELVINNHCNQAGRFILATNLLDEERSLITASTGVIPPAKWTNDLILKEYKNQQTTERGFRFIKDPLFFVSRVFLKSTKRIMALAMIMTLALMVYSLGQRQLRQALELTQSTLPNQKGQATARPTLRWILQCFQSVHLIFIDGIKSRIQLTSKQTLILQFLCASSRQYYFLS